MSRVYDNWERLVEATLRREQLKISAQRTPSELSSASLSSSSFSFSESFHRVSSSDLSSGLLAGESFSYHQILQATDYFNEHSNLIKHGHSGDLFYGILEGGMQVVVKKIDPSLVKKELDVFRKVSHFRLVPLLGHCLDEGNKKILVYKYMPNRDLSTLLYSELNSEDDDDILLSSLDWKTRSKIATGVAEGLFYLHHQCVPPLVHRDIQASSILLDDKFEVRLGSLMKVSRPEGKDRGIARFLRLPKRTAQETSGISTATFAHDIYCFGKILIELITGRPSLSVLLELVTSKLGLTSANGNWEGPESVPITGKNDYPEDEDWMANTLPYISIYDDRKLVLKIVDPSLNIDEDLLIEVWAVAVVAKACLNPKPSRRPQMTYVLEALRNPLRVVSEGGSVWDWPSASDGPRPADPPSSVPPLPEKRKVPEGAFRPAEMELEYF